MECILSFTPVIPGVDSSYFRLRRGGGFKQHAFITTIPPDLRLISNMIGL